MPFQYPIIPAVSLVALLTVADAPAFAQSSLPKPPPRVAAPQALVPAEINAIRGVSRHVLAAKHGAVDDGADAELLKQLRAEVDQLLAAESVRPLRTPLTLQQQQAPSSTPLGKSLTGPARPGGVATRALVERLQQHATTMETHARAKGGGEAGRAIGPQRARLFRRWAGELDAALATADAGDRAVRLRALQNRLAEDRPGLHPAALAHGTPTLQAMPAGDITLPSLAKP